MTTAELIARLKEVDPSGTLTVVNVGECDTYTIRAVDVTPCKLFQLTDEKWVSYSPGKLPGPFPVIAIL